MTRVMLYWSCARKISTLSEIKPARSVVHIFGGWRVHRCKDIKHIHLGEDEEDIRLEIA